MFSATLDCSHGWRHPPPKPDENGITASHPNKTANWHSIDGDGEYKQTKSFINSFFTIIEYGFLCWCNYPVTINCRHVSPLMLAKFIQIALNFPSTTASSPSLSTHTHTRTLACFLCHLFVSSNRGPTIPDNIVAYRYIPFVCIYIDMCVGVAVIFI